MKPTFGAKIQARVVGKVDRMVYFVYTYPVDSDLSTG